MKSVLIVGDVFIEAFRLSDQSSFEDDPPFLVPLVLLGGELVNPAEFGITVFTGYIPDHVASGEHHPVLHFAVVEVDHSVEEECSASGSCEPRRNEFRSVGERCVTACA